MNDGQFSSMTRSMIDAARADAPGAAVRAKVWTQVSGAVGTGAAGAGAAAAGSAGAAKLLIAGALLGGTLTVGLAVTMLRLSGSGVGSVPTGTHVLAAKPAAVVQPDPEARVPGQNAAPSPAAPSPAAGLPAAAASTHVATATPVTPPRPPVAAAAARTGATLDPLEREAQLVSEARGALGRGDARRALQAVRAARALPSHQLAPEELAVEAQALRALGRAGDANQVDDTLRSKFPESALAR